MTNTTISRVNYIQIILIMCGATVEWVTKQTKTIVLYNLLYINFKTFYLCRGLGGTYRNKLKYPLFDMINIHVIGHYYNPLLPSSGSCLSEEEWCGRWEWWLFNVNS